MHQARHGVHSLLETGVELTSADREGHYRRSDFSSSRYQSVCTSTGLHHRAVEMNVLLDDGIGNGLVSAQIALQFGKDLIVLHDAQDVLIGVAPLLYDLLKLFLSQFFVGFGRQDVFVGQRREIVGGSRRCGMITIVVVVVGQ